MTAAELRAAADRLDALAGVATPGPWRAWGEEFFFVDSGPQTNLIASGSASQPDAAYIAAMHPGVAKALAEWLRAEADAHIHHDNGDPLSVWDLPGMDQHPALAVARAINPP